MKLFHQYADIFHLDDHEAEETQKKIHAAIISANGVLEHTYTAYMNPPGFPRDIAARDFLECLKLYWEMSKEMWREAREIILSELGEPSDEQIGEVAKVAGSIPEKDLEELLNQLTPTQRKVFDLMVDGSHPQLKDFMNDKALISKKGEQMAEGTIKTHVSAICKIFGVPNRKALAAKVKPLLPPKAKT